MENRRMLDGLHSGLRAHAAQTVIAAYQKSKGGEEEE